MHGLEWRSTAGSFLDPIAQEGKIKGQSSSSIFVFFLKNRTTVTDTVHLDKQKNLLKHLEEGTCRRYVGWIKV